MVTFTSTSRHNDKSRVMVGGRRPRPVVTMPALGSMLMSAALMVRLPLVLVLRLACV